jgi:exosome complex RNA-binding protein Csl4
MLPLNWKEMIDPETGIKETRKVAMPNFSYFSDNI